MAKKRKKKNYRLRKSVRRTLGALFLMSAIIVAAIPFPDAAATNGTTAIPANNTKTTIDPIDSMQSYDTLVQKNTEINSGINLSRRDNIQYENSGSASKDGGRALSMYYNEDGVWECQMQYDYYYTDDTKNSEAKEAILNHYNDDYSVKSITLKGYINEGEYITIAQDEFKNKFSTNSINISIDIHSSENDIARFQKYFPNKKAEYDELKKQYEQGTILENAVTVSSDSKSVPDNLREQFYCDYVTIEGFSFKDNYQLVAVEDSKKYMNKGTTVYVVRYTGSEADSGSGQGWRKDSNGFIYKVFSSSDESCKLVGIAEGAFSGITKAMTLVLPETVVYIGDSAFENSFVTEIEIKNVDKIGNYAFRGSQLSKISITTSTSIIGTEAFSNTALTSVEIPYSIIKIGDGAFAKNKYLTTVTYVSGQLDLEIGNCAFYNCIKLGNQELSNSRISKIGDGAFALGSSDSGNCTKFLFPDQISSADNIGNHILAGRTNLEEVKMPKELGFNSETTLKNTIFKGCSNLKYVEFPTTCMYVNYAKNIFSDVQNLQFYVRGPKTITSGDTAYPRKSTWVCRLGATDSDGNQAYAPYVYTVNGEDYYEVCMGDYLYAINGSGILQSCTLMTSGINEIEKLVIPSIVGNITVTGIATDCFNSEIISKIKTLRIEDGGALAEIADGVFKGAEKLTEAYIGNSVVKIGAEAFKDCTKLEKITFSEPTTGIASFPVENIGKDALSTGSDKLTVIGVIAQGYGPFDWAMDENNYINKELGIRVCYKSAEKYGMTVILNNEDNLATLVDYPQYLDLPADLRKRYEENQDGLTPAELNAVNSVFYIDIPAGVESIDVQGFLRYAKGNGYNITSYDLNPNSSDTKIAERFSNYNNYGLFNGNTADSDASTPNSIADETKELGNDRIKRITMSTVKYLPTNTQSTSSRAIGAADDKIAQNGLAMGAFYSCEDLETVILGEAMEDVGELPFKGCYKLTNVSASDPFTCENGILYKKLDDGTYKIEEVLGGKAGVINTTDNPLLAQTSEIAMGAFSDCLEIKTVNFKNAEKLDEIPEKCFFGSDNLEVILTKQILRVGDFAFAESDGIVEVTVEGNTTSIPKNAFDGTKKAVVYALPDSAAYNAFSKSDNVEVKIIEDYYTVRFIDYDGSTFEGEDYGVQEVEFMGYAKDPKITPTREKYVFTGWYPDYKTTPITKDQDFIAQYVTDEEYYNNNMNGGNGSGNNGSGNGDNGSNNNGGNNVNGGIDTDGDGIPDVDEDGNKLYKLTVANGSGSGYYAAGKTVSILADAASSGATFGYWSCSNSNLIFNDSTKPSTNLTMVADDVTVIANYVGQYTLEVVYGSGSGSYPAGTKVAISAVDAPQGRRFASWVSGTSGLTIESSTKATTVITMPASHAKVTATYADTGSISGNSTSNKKPSQNGTSVVITKDGISDKDKASAYVTGSSDNFIVKISESLEAADEVQKALQKKYPDMTRIKYFAMDISLYDAKGETKITDTTGLKVNITMPIPDALKEYAGNNRVGAVVNGELETLNPKFTTIDGVPSVSFTATHFSPYTIYVDTGNLTVSDTLDSTPKTGDAIHPKWFLSLGLACISVILFTKKDRRYTVKAYH